MSPQTQHRLMMPFAPFDPELGETVLSPERDEPGYWTGCPGVLHEAETGRFLMTYRQRRPRGHEVERGWRCAVAQSTDGLHFEDVWEVHKSELGSSSMERFSLLPTTRGGYLLYLSYVDPEDSRWRVDVVEAKSPSDLDATTRQPVLTAATTGTEGVKDPYALRIGPTVHLIVSFAVGGHLSDDERVRAHRNADIYTSDLSVFPSGLATSVNGLDFDWHGSVFEVGAEWDRYQSRLNSVVDLGGLFLGFYDGSRSSSDNYEERTGIALSADLRGWQRLSPRQPWLSSPHASGSLRYLDAVPVGDELFIYYEYARPSGAHELRLSRVPVAQPR